MSPTSRHAGRGRGGPAFHSSHTGSNGSCSQSAQLGTKTGTIPAVYGLQAQGKAAWMPPGQTAEWTASPGQGPEHRDRDWAESLPSCSQRDSWCQILPAAGAWTERPRSSSPSSSAAGKSDNQCRGEETMLSLQNIRICIRSIFFLADLDRFWEKSPDTGNSPKQPWSPRVHPCFRHLNTRKARLFAQHKGKIQSIMSRVYWFPSSLEISGEKALY